MNTPLDTACDVHFSMLRLASQCRTPNSGEYALSQDEDAQTSPAVPLAFLRNESQERVSTMASKEICLFHLTTQYTSYVASDISYSRLPYSFPKAGLQAVGPL